MVGSTLSLKPPFMTLGTVGSAKFVLVPHDKDMAEEHPYFNAAFATKAIKVGAKIKREVTMLRREEPVEVELPQGFVFMTLPYTEAQTQKVKFIIHSLYPNPSHKMHSDVEGKSPAQYHELTRALTDDEAVLAPRGVGSKGAKRSRSAAS